MKVLKRLSEGRISYIDFTSGGTLNEPFINNSNNTLTGNSIILNRGSIDFDTFSYSNFVLEVDNEYIPQNETEFAGVSVNRGTEKIELYEYYKSGDTFTFPHVKLIKNGDVYTGYGSEDGLEWLDKGYIHYPDASTASITVVGDSPFEITKIKLYKSEYVSFFTLIPGWKVEVSDGATIIQEATAVEQFVKIKLPFYPFSGTFKIFDDTNTLVTEKLLSDVWGGDEYVYMANVELRTEDDEPLIFHENRNLGRIENRFIEQRLKAVNLGDEVQNIRVKVAPYSPFGDWVSLSAEVDGDSVDYINNYVDLEVPASGEIFFWIMITRPDGFNLPGFDYRIEKCRFYLEVV